MYTYKRLKANLTISDILSRVSEIDVFSFFINEPIELDVKIYKAPYREDHNGTCYFEEFGENGEVRFVDFSIGMGHHSVTCISFAMLCLQIDFYSTLEYLWEELKLYDKKPKFQVKNIQTYHTDQNTADFKHREIKFARRKFDNRDKKFWTQYRISKVQLIEDKVIPISAYQVYSKKLNRYVVITCNDIAYAYTDFKDSKVKIYRPYNKEFKWTTNCNMNDIGCYESLTQTGEKLVITKSYKDCRVLRNLGLNSIWLQNEVAIPSRNIFEDLCKRFKKIFVIFDNDSTGLAFSKKIVDTINSIKAGVAINSSLPVYYSLEGIKDSSDLVKNKGLEELTNFLKLNEIL